MPTEHWLAETENVSPQVEVRVWRVDRPPHHVLGTDAARVSMVVWPGVAPPAAGDTLALLPRLRLVQAMTAGFDHLRGLVPPGVQVCNASPALAASASELAVALVLASQRRIPFALAQAANRTWGEFSSASLADRAVLIIGAGAIGAAIAARLRPFEVTLTRVARRRRDDADGVVHSVRSLPSLLPEQEVVVLAAPLTAETAGLVDRDFLGHMRDGALLVNVARGGLVRTDALVRELGAGRLRAALDVVDPEPLPASHPLWGTPQTLLTPHVGGSSSTVRRRVAEVLREQIRRLAADDAPIGLVMEGAPCRAGS